MAIKKGHSHYFCDSCGTHVTHVQHANPPKFCLHCIGTAGGSHLNDESLKFLVGKIEEYNEVKKGSEAEIKDLRLKILLARLYIEKVTIYEANIHRLPDGEDKNRKCKTILDDLNQMARKIHPLLVHKEKP